jgi:Subtilase family
MADAPPRPLLNPVLTLKLPATAERPDVVIKKKEQIVEPRLATQRQALTDQIDELIRQRAGLHLFGGSLLLVVEMFTDSLAVTHTPRDLFSGKSGTQLIGAAAKGYLAELTIDDLRALAQTIRTSTTIGHRCDISRVETIRPFLPADALRRTIGQLWDAAAKIGRGKGFILWLAPFRRNPARAAVVKAIEALAGTNLLPTFPRLRIAAPDDDPRGPPSTLPVTVPNQSSLAIAFRDLVATGHARAVVEIPTAEALGALAASGGAFRIDPVQDIAVTIPGTGQEPGPVPPDIADQPIVAMVDGGRTARRYDMAEAWREPPLFRAALLDSVHGNHTTALAVHGHAWNNNLPLPPLYCRVGTVPVVPRNGSGQATNPAQLIAYLDAVIRRHPDTKVWNMSFNEACSIDVSFVSYLGHELTLLARRHRVLFVVSVGNQPATQGSLLAPPGDCEAALVVAGRMHNTDGSLAGPCHVSLPGPGPQGQLRPDLSYYSTLRLLGGQIATASSYPTVLISGLAAHTFANLKDPSPDLVRALLINQTDLAEHEHRRGWGSPSTETRPWLCPPGTVTLAWTAKVRPGYAYYWDDIPVPRQIIDDGRLKGRGSLTVILNPLTNPEVAANYFSTRITAALQYKSRTGSTTRLLGSSEAEDTALEVDARNDYSKWQPIRHHARDFSKRPLTFSGDTFRLYARAYGRDREAHNYTSNADFGELEATIVLALSDGSQSSELYNGMVVSLGNFVESAVIDQEIQIE